MYCNFCKSLIKDIDLVGVKTDFKNNKIDECFKCSCCGNMLVSTRDLTKAEYFICKNLEDKKLAKRERIKEGLRNSGKPLGRPKFDLEKHKDIIERYNKGEITAKQACKEMHISRTTFYKKTLKK